MVNSSKEFITNSYGERCIQYYENPLFKYNGTVLNEYTDFYYLVTNDTTIATIDSISNFTNLFDSNSGVPKDLPTIQGKVTSGAGLVSFTMTPPSSDTILQYTDLYNESPAAAGVTITVGSISSPNTNTIPITITSTAAYKGGSVYIGIDMTNSSSTPTPDGLMNCKLNSTYNLSNCNRVVLNSGAVNNLLK
jgi:hypothetical protein